MSALQATIEALNASDDVTAIVDDRIDAILSLQGTVRPLIIVHLIAETPAQLLEGGAGYYGARVSIECHADTATEADALGEAVKAYLENVINQTFAGLQCSFRKEETDETDYSDDTAVKRRVQDWRCWWRNV